MFERYKVGDREMVKCILDKQVCTDLLVTALRINESVVRLNETILATLSGTSLPFHEVAKSPEKAAGENRTRTESLGSTCTTDRETD